MGYDPPDIPEGPCSVSQLTDLILHFRPYELALAERGWSGPALSEHGVRRLIELAFYASLSPEEGRYPRTKLACPDSDSRAEIVMRFQPVLLDGVDVVRKLAPACVLPDSALLVSEKENHLYCDGLLQVGQLGSDSVPGRPFGLGVRTPAMFRVEIKGPGHIVAGPTHVSYEFRGGSIRRLSALGLIPVVESFARAFGEYILERFKASEPESPDMVWTGGRGSEPAMTLLSRMVRVPIESGHGGAFIIVPSDSCDTQAFDIELNYCVQDSDLGASIIEFWSACAASQRESAYREYPSELASWSSSRAKLISHSEAIGNLSFTDGCVVLNEQLRVCGFGGEIRVKDDDANREPRPFKDWDSGEETDYDVFIREIGGTRHKSAARLCRRHGGILAFVVSQDGVLKVFSSDEKGVHGFGPVDPYPWVYV
jgi:hypothetical protein